MVNLFTIRFGLIPNMLKSFEENHLENKENMNKKNEHVINKEYSQSWIECRMQWNRFWYVYFPRNTRL